MVCTSPFGCLFDDRNTDTTSPGLFSSAKSTSLPPVKAYATRWSVCLHLTSREQSPPLPDGWFNWIGPFWKLPDSTALRHQSIDGYLFIRYIKICAIIAFVSGCITWPILFPVNATGGGDGSQLDILSFSNVNNVTHKNYYYAHVFVGWAVYGFVMYMITREIIFYINLRNAFFNHPNYARRISARTVLFTNVPADYLDEARLRTMFPNAVKHVWIAGDTTELDETVGDRDDAAMKLEKAEVKLIKAVNKARSKDIKKNGAPREQDQPEQPAHQGDGDAETGNIASRWVPDNKRPSHRLGFLGLVGKKVDTIEWARTELHELIPKAESQQSEYLAGNRKALSAVFIEFNSQRDAQAAYQTVTHHKSLHMDPKAIGITPDDVVWKSLNIPWWQIVIRRYAVYAFIAVLIIFWAVPVGIVGIISSVETLKTLPGLTWIQDIPQVCYRLLFYFQTMYNSNITSGSANKTRSFSVSFPVCCPLFCSQFSWQWYLLLCDSVQNLPVLLPTRRSNCSLNMPTFASRSFKSSSFARSPMLRLRFFQPS